jgi:hypothetical protein
MNLKFFFVLFKNTKKHKKFQRRQKKNTDQILNKKGFHRKIFNNKNLNYFNIIK